MHTASPQVSGTRADDKGEVFLATTALEQFWDTTQPIVFLGEWCLLYGRRSFWEPLGGRLLESPFDGAGAVRAAYDYVNGIYERVLPLLGDALNVIHGTRHGRRYWRIVLGPWLQSFLSATYDRYVHLKRALERYPDCASIVLSERSFVVPSDTLQYARYLTEDFFNLQVYTRILAVLGKTFPCKEASMPVSSTYTAPVFDSWRRKAAVRAARCLASIGTDAFRSIVLRASLFSKGCELLLFGRTGGKVFPIWGQLPKPASLEYDEDMRKNLRNFHLGDGEFERCLAALLSLDMPKCFVEGYASVGREAQEQYPRKVRAIFSSNAWYFDETFKQWAAASAEQGALLMGTPHGGNYGGMAIMPSEDHETSIVDRYYSWGWERTDCAAEVVPLPASRLAGRRKIGASNLKTGVLWVTTSLPRYLNEFPALPGYFHEYIVWQGRFADTLLREIVSVLRVRPHPDGDGWDIVRRLTERNPGVTIETGNVSFEKSLANCRLYVCDHFSTTFAEALSANKPTILFWSPRANELRVEAQPYYDLLRKRGILFDTPEGAGAAVNQVYDNVEAWWNDPERRDAVERFCERFARNAPDAVELWAGEFKRIANAAMRDK